jgi:hypothetical protein
MHAPEWLHVEEGLARCGFDPARTEDFDRWVNDSAEHVLDYSSLIEVRQAARQRGAIEIGSPTAGDSIEVPLLMRPHGFVRPSPSEVIALVATVTKIDIGQLCSRSANPRAVSARRVAVHVGKRAGLTASDLAAALGISAQAASKLGRSELSSDETSTRDIVERRALRDRAFTGTVLRR